LMSSCSPAPVFLAKLNEELERLGLGRVVKLRGWRYSPYFEPHDLRHYVYEV